MRKKTISIQDEFSFGPRTHKAFLMREEAISTSPERNGTQGEGVNDHLEETFSPSVWKA